MNLLNLFRQVNTAFATSAPFACLNSNCGKAYSELSMREEDSQREIELYKNAKTKVRSGAEGVPKQCNKDYLVEVYKGTKHQR